MSDERREVAARLREAAVDDGHVGRPYGEQGFQVTLRRIIGTSNPKRSTLYTRLADLIDPTCHDISSKDFEFMCSSCNAYTDKPGQYGSEIGYVEDSGENLRYCPNCGARVVDE